MDIIKHNVHKDLQITANQVTLNSFFLFLLICTNSVVPNFSKNAIKLSRSESNGNPFCKKATTSTKLQTQSG